MKHLTSLKSSFIFKVWHGIRAGWTPVLSVGQKCAPDVDTRLSSWLFPGNQTGHHSFFITGMPHVLTQHISSGMKTSENREEETEPSTLVQCFDARFGCVGCRAAFSRQTNGPEEKLVPCKGYSSGHSVQHMDMGTTSTCRKRSFSLFLPPA